MPAIINLNSEFGGSVVGSTSLASGIPVVRLTSTTTIGVALALDRTVLSAPTGALISLNVGSGASAAVLQLDGQSFVSAVSIVFAASANWAGLGGVNVLLPDGVTKGWIPVLPPAVVTAAAR